MDRVKRIPLAALLLAATACSGAEMVDNPCGVSGVERYMLGSEVVGCLGANADVRVYQVTAPGDGVGGYVQASVIGAGAAAVRLTAYDGTGTAELARFGSQGPGAAATFFLAVAPGQDYRFAVANEDTFAEPYTYTLATTYTQVPDSSEPNDTLGAPTPLAVGAPLQAYLFAGRHGGEDDPDAYDDYYRFSAVGSVTIRIEDVPSDVAPRLTLYGSDGKEAARVASGIRGGTVVLRALMLPGPGDPVVRVAPWSDAPQSMGRGPSLPEHFTRPYKLSVSQP
jgi:hypothetical protein